MGYLPAAPGAEESQGMWVKAPFTPLSLSRLTPNPLNSTSGLALLGLTLLTLLSTQSW